MNKAKLKSYAPQARQDFIAAVTARANLLGLSDKSGQLEVAPAQTQGDVTLIAGQAWPAKVAAQRDQLITRMRREGFAHTCEAVAYTWFNRFAALRYMELHDYLGHGHRALSSSTGNLPDILTHAADLAQGTDSGLPGLNATKVLEMKLAGNRDGELYRMLLVAQCNALSASMPFLFERIDDDTELLLPDNLLRTDSVIAKLVQAIPEEDWAEVEIIGWLYQFYISEKKDQVIGKVVKSEDIPAATQLFTPNWIVQYLVQNSVGRLWLMANPASTLASQWPYYIQPAEQTPEVQAQLDALIQTRMREDSPLEEGSGEWAGVCSLNPESITVLDPACGSGHILVVAYDVLKAIYLERGYQARAIPRLILEKNLYGLDIDDRAAQMAGFALLMKARADDRRLFNEPPKLNVLSMQTSKGLDATALARALLPLPLGEGGGEGSPLPTIRWLIDTFEHAKTFGSLIQIEPQRMLDVRKQLSLVQQAMQAGDLYAQAAAHDLLPLVQQALVLGMQFDAVVANPPYMSSKGMTSPLKVFTSNQFLNAKSDLFACFMERGCTLTKSGGHIAMVTMQSWMFLSTFEKMREQLLRTKSLNTMIQIGFNSFPSLNSKIALATAFSTLNVKISGLVSTFVDLNSAPQSADKQEVFLTQPLIDRFSVCTDEFEKIPGSPVAYWVSKSLRDNFTRVLPLHNLATPRAGMITGENAIFVRAWHEVSIAKVGLDFESRKEAQDSHRKWFPYQKGGQIRKWSGNREYVVDWKNDGERLRTTRGPNGNIPAHAFNEEYIFQPNVNWSAISIFFSARVTRRGALFDAAGSAAFPGNVEKSIFLAGFLNSKVAGRALGAINPTVNFQAWNIGNLPLDTSLLNSAELSKTLWSLHDVAETDWNAFETAWEFRSLPVLSDFFQPTLKSSYASWISNNNRCIQEMKLLEEKNNRLFIDAYGLGNEISPDVPLSQITLLVNPANRYVVSLTVDEQWARFRQEACEELISYAIGCMMGRYSLDEPGLIYAHAGNVGFDASRYASFPADADGIVPLTDERWFNDDAASRVREFLLAVWGADTLEENMAWLAESLGKKSTGGANETPDETIRRYLADKFFKDHLQTYKKRPIYWLFSSGKQGAFQALVYLHRYTEGTLARLRAEYVVPLTGKLQARIAMLQKDQEAASSTAGRNKLSKEIEKLKKKHTELLAYDEQLRHYADMRITLDLDDGVKVNYGKFGDLLDSVKAVTGGKDEE